MGYLPGKGRLGPGGRAGGGGGYQGGWDIYLVLEVRLNLDKRVNGGLFGVREVGVPPGGETWGQGNPPLFFIDALYVVPTPGGG